MDDVSSVATSALSDADPVQLTFTNETFLLMTIIMFLILSIISGKVVWQSSNPSKMTSTLEKSGFNESFESVQSVRLQSFHAIPIHESDKRPRNSSASSSCIDTNTLLDEEPFAAQSTGSEMRHRFFLLLFLASTIRVCTLIAELSTIFMRKDAMHQLQPSLFYSIFQWLLAIFIWIPSLLFVTMYGLVLLFWSQLCYSCWRRAYPWPRRIFFMFNVILYAFFVSNITLTGNVRTFWRACDIILGIVYFAGFFGMLYYSLRLIYFFRNQETEHLDSQSLLLRKRSIAYHTNTESSTTFRFGIWHKNSPHQLVLKRITAVCVVLCTLFMVKSVYLIGMGSGCLPSYEGENHFPMGPHHIGFEFVMHFITEFVPCALITYLTRKERANVPLYAKRSDSSSQRSQASAGPLRSVFKSSSPRQSIAQKTSKSLLGTHHDNAVSGYLY